MHHSAASTTQGFTLSLKKPLTVEPAVRPSEGSQITCWATEAPPIALCLDHLYHLEHLELVVSNSVIANRALNVVVYWRLACKGGVSKFEDTSSFTVLRLLCNPSAYHFKPCTATLQKASIPVLKVACDNLSSTVLELWSSTEFIHLDLGLMLGCLPSVPGLVLDSPRIRGPY